MNRKQIRNNKIKRSIKGLFTVTFLGLFIIFTLFFTGCNAFNPQTGSLEGEVHRQTIDGSVPLEGALVTVNGAENTAQSDQEGYFLLNEVPAGKRTVTIIKDGYITAKLINVYIEPDIVNEANIGQPVILKAKEDRAVYDIAMEYYQQEDYSQALTEFKSLIDNYPSSSWADDSRYQIAWCYINIENYTQSIIEFENLLLNYADSEYRDDAQYYMGWCYEKKLGLPIPAIMAYYSLLLEYPDSEWADDTQLGIGNCYYVTQDYGNAITEYQKVIDNYPLSDLLPLAQYSIAQSYRLAYYRTTAIEEYRELILTYPYSEYCGPSQYYIGYCYYEKNDYQTAISEFQKVLYNYPNSTWPDETREVAPSAQFYIGWCYEKLSLWAEALEVYQSLINKYPGSTFSDGSSIPVYVKERIDWINETYFPESPEE
ncbi:MAG: tetratricopeptide repeat protein [Atribacterota bacterium]|nr:tetratricopeptide repeat protein [Atribacterota bacterium]